jgi:hypothetical protein
LKINSQLKSDFVVKSLNSWIENNYMKIRDYINNRSNESISYGHRVFDPNRTVLLHIQMEFRSKTFKQLMAELNISQP